MNSTTTRTIAADNSFTLFGERYATNGYIGYFAGMLMQYPFMTDGYQADHRMYHYAEGRWVSPDPAGLSEVDPTHPQTWNRYSALDQPNVKCDLDDFLKVVTPCCSDRLFHNHPIKQKEVK